jgi:hypothetical protein
LLMRVSTDNMERFVGVLQQIANLQSFYLLFFPYLTMIIMDCVVIFHNLFVIWDINLVPANVTIKDYFALNRMS